MNYFQQKRLYAPGFGGYTPHHTGLSAEQKKKKIWFWSLLGSGVFVLVFGIWFVVNVLVGLPDVTQVKNMVFSQATVIADRN